MRQLKTIYTLVNRKACWNLTRVSVIHLQYGKFGKNGKLVPKMLHDCLKFLCWFFSCKLGSAADSCEYAWILVWCFEYELPHCSVFHPSEHFTGLKYLRSLEVWIRESPLYSFVVDLCFQHASRCCRHFVWIFEHYVDLKTQKKTHPRHWSRWGILGWLIY